MNIYNSFIHFLGEINIINIGKDGRDMYARRCSDSLEYRPALAQLKAQQITHIIVDTDPKQLQILFRAVRYHDIFICCLNYVCQL